MPLLSDCLQPYVRNYQIFDCPSDTGMNFDPISGQSVNCTCCWQQYGLSYSFRTALAFNHATVSGITQPAAVNVLGDSNGAWHFGTVNQWLSYRYNVLFADGHVKLLTYAAYVAAWETQLFPGSMG
jgi:prepilin-type processing-associated H-X9-DG protein